MGQCATKVDDVNCCQETGSGACVIEKLHALGISETYPSAADEIERTNSFKYVSSVGAMSGRSAPNSHSSLIDDIEKPAASEKPTAVPAPAAAWTWQPPKDAQAIEEVAEAEDGDGRKVFPDGSTYTGQFKESKAHGRGTLEHKDGSVYRGEWMNDKAHGHGEYIGKDQTSYKGQWVWEKKHGHGEETCADGRCYEGQYKKGVKDGIGFYTCAGGATYEGEFQADTFHGEGIYTWTDNRRYDGQWRQNEMHGFGDFTFADGRSYRGQYERNQKSGEGTFTWPDGRTFEGQWQNGKQHGYGKITHSTADKRAVATCGRWEAGTRITPSEEAEDGKAHASNGTVTVPDHAADEEDIH